MNRGTLKTDFLLLNLKANRMKSFEDLGRRMRRIVSPLFLLLFRIPLPEQKVPAY